LRGQGKSGRAPGQYRPEHYAADLKAFLQRQLTEQAVLFGLSAGGLIALDTAAQLPERVRAVVIGDSPIDMDALITLMHTDESAAHFAALRELANSGRSLAELAAKLAELPVWVPGQDKPIPYRDRPGVDDAHLRAWAKMVSQLDPGTLDFHAEQRAAEFLSKLDMDALLSRIACPVLLVQGNPALGAMLTSEAVDHAMRLLADGTHVLIEQTGHDLGLGNWEVAPLLRTVIDFLESL
jgi:pimeloyl-ACP methyl ester carboxylesterase